MSRNIDSIFKDVMEATAAGVTFCRFVNGMKLAPFNKGLTGNGCIGIITKRSTLQMKSFQTSSLLLIFAVVVPVQKSNLNSSLSNFCPISIFTSFFKVL